MGPRHALYAGAFGSRRAAHARLDARSRGRGVGGTRHVLPALPASCHERPVSSSVSDGRSLLRAQAEIRSRRDFLECVLSSVRTLTTAASPSCGENLLTAEETEKTLDAEDLTPFWTECSLFRSS